jgi:hypothetical protein
VNYDQKSIGRSKGKRTSLPLYTLTVLCALTVKNTGQYTLATCMNLRSASFFATQFDWMNTSLHWVQIYKQLTSPHLPLPWEVGRISSEDSKKLGRLRKPILKLLEREPSQRDSALQFCKSMLEIFRSTPGGSTVQNDTVLLNPCINIWLSC